MDFELRYIHPVWSNKDQISYIDVSPSQIEINEIAAHSFSANTLAFIRINEDEDAYIGLKIFTENQPTPYVEKIDKTRENLKLIKAPDGSNWWIIANSWSTKDKEYRTQAFNRMGEITVIIGDNTLTLTNETNNFNYEDLQYILNDFKSNLWQIIADRNSITATNVYNSIPIFSTAKSIDNLSKFIIHLEKLLKNPEKKLVETTEIKRRDRSKIIKNSFRDLLKNPSAQYLSSRYFVESFDTPANKYMHFCLNRIIYILNIYKNISFEKQSFIKNILEKQEISKKKYLDTTYETLQREVLKNQLDSFENQLCKISKKLCDFKIDTPIQDQNQIQFSIKFKEPCKNYDNSYFIEDPKFPLDKKIDYVVLELPENWKEYKHLFQKNYIFEVTAKVFGKYIQSKKDGLLLTLSEIKNVSIHADEYITNIKNKLNTEFIDNINVDDIQREKKIVNRNIDNYQNMSKVMKDSDDKIDSLFKKAKKISRQFKKKKIGIQSKYPQSILFVTNKLYSTPYNLYKKLTEEFGINERVITQLEQTEKIGLIKINEIYESWCLISIIKILIERLGFKPDENWADKIIESVFSKGKNAEITFHFTHDGYLEPIHLRLTYQKILPNGKRPDFVLEIENNNDSSNSYTPLILDAKFRGDVTKESIDKDINDMFYGRKYGDYGKVFILHTSCKAMYDKNNNFISLSPLSWGAYSSYGGEEEHIKGHIFFLPSSRYPFSYDNLQRLIGLFLQQNSDLVGFKTEEGYKYEKTNNILCIGCGSKDLSISIDHTGKGNMKYYIECNKCGLKTERTLCFCCQRNKLYKNGIHWTYHITKAYQITNVVCPKCNSYL